MRKTLTDTKGEIDSNTQILGHVNTTPKPRGRSTKQKINKQNKPIRKY